MINFILWKWHQPNFVETYTSVHVNAVLRMLKNTCTLSYRVICVTDDPVGVACETFPLWTDHSHLPNLSGRHLPSCYRRLKIFDRETQELLDIPRGQRIVSLDLDSILLKDLDPLFQRKEQFIGWHVPGHKHRWVMNGSMFMFTAGELEWLWQKFDPKTSPQNAIKKDFMGSDQGYLSQNLIGQPYVGSWTAQKDGVKSYFRDVRRSHILSKDTRIVFFAGRNKPWHPKVQHESQWIHRYVDYSSVMVHQTTEPEHANV